ncbi:MAG: hypothetical protein PHQ60_10400 [Sideroxydans sp.]|nr:hypothetical protein [Sideroxydans sp.]
MVARHKKNLIDLGTKELTVYASPRISSAMEIVTEDMTLMKGAKLSLIFDAIYEQGKKDGARSAIETLQGKVKEIEKEIPHRNPGKPKKK